MDLACATLKIIVGIRKPQSSSQEEESIALPTLLIRTMEEDASVTRKDVGTNTIIETSFQLSSVEIFK